MCLQAATLYVFYSFDLWFGFVFLFVFTWFFMQMIKITKKTKSNKDIKTINWIWQTIKLWTNKKKHIVPLNSWTYWQRLMCWFETRTLLVVRCVCVPSIFMRFKNHFHQAMPKQTRYCIEHNISEINPVKNFSSKPTRLKFNQCNNNKLYPSVLM